MEKSSTFSLKWGPLKKKSFSLYKQNPSYKKIKELCLDYVGVFYRTPQFVTVFTRDRQEAIFLFLTQFRYRTGNRRRETS